MDNPLALGLEDPRKPSGVDLVVFGATGDLARRKLLPALHGLVAGRYVEGLRVLGFARRDWTDAAFRAEARAAVPAAGEEFLRALAYHRAAFDDLEGYRGLAARLPPGRQRVFYLATPPEHYGDIIGRLGESALSRRGDARTRIVVEKPFGRDAASARELNALLARHFDEAQVYRIDHYVGKETVRNIAALRFGNSVLEPLWNSERVAYVEITAAERVGVEGRGAYYEAAGALRDMVQNHLLQLLAAAAMDPPNRLDSAAIHDEKAKALRSLAPIDPRTASVRAQYAAGVIDGEALPAYRAEGGVSPASATETYAALRVDIDSWRWKGTPFFLRTGKRLSRRLSEIVLHFRKPAIDLFGAAAENILAVGIQPDEGLSLRINSKVPGHGFGLRPARMDFPYGDSFGPAPSEAYEKLLLDAFAGDSTLFTRRDEIEAGWDWSMPVLESWAAGEVPLASYRAGSSGPAEARELLARAGASWRRL